MRAPHLTVRRWIALVAASAIVLSFVHQNGPRPGLYASVGGLSLGVCRNESIDRFILAYHARGGWAHQAGLWQSEGHGNLIAGVEIQNGRVIVRAKMGINAVIW
ncbi:hypothetical protein P12x_000421 [Tundrisphaera lichenicola]|uniref:hypothetical protein n=1 Tax=Tundrisphaera lichenicola TaxID=2029860 RepID=UPI003EBDDDAE